MGFFLQFIRDDDCLLNRHQIREFIICSRLLAPLGLKSWVHVEQSNVRN